MSKHTIQITDDKLYEDIISYCKVNNIKIGSFCTEMLKKQFILEQYGDIPFGNIVNNELPILNSTTNVSKIEEEKTNDGSIKPFETIIIKEPIKTEIETLKPRKRRL